ncbi:MAG: ATP-binding cassette domain-containing protein [Desulfonatronovibrionaceae bacterium]
MLRLSLNAVSHGFDGTDLFTDLSLELCPGMKLAVAGPNGCGKSTLLDIMAGEIIPERGNVFYPSGARIGRVMQEISGDDLQSPLLDYMLGVLPDWGQFWRAWKAAVDCGDEKALHRLAARQEELEQRFGYSPEHEAEKILHGLGFSDADFRCPLESLSGGWRERAKLARVLLQGADMLLLDEPTNHLDLEAVLWLEDYLAAFQGVLAFVAHDLYFVDKTASHVLYLGFDRPYFRPGGLSAFFDWHEEKEGYKRDRVKGLEARINHKQKFVDRFRYKASKARQAQARIKEIEGLRQEMRGLQADKSGPGLSFSWPEPERGSKVPVSGAGVSFGYKEVSLFRDLDFSIMRGQKVALVGPNGRGKSTLLKIMAGMVAPDSGEVRVGAKVSFGYYAQHQTEILENGNSVLAEIKRLTGCTREEEIRSVLGLFLLGENMWPARAGSLSGGEKSRLILATLFLARANVLLLDEPTNHLDMESREALIAALRDFSGTVVLVAHDRQLLDQVAGEVWLVREDDLYPLRGGVEEYVRSFREDRFAPILESGMEKKKEPGVSSRRVKRMQAEKRNEIHRRLKPLEEEFGRLEKQLEEAIVFQEKAEAALSSPETYQDRERIKGLTRELKNSRQTSEEIFERMSWIEAEMEELKKERESLKAGG